MTLQEIADLYYQKLDLRESAKTKRQFCIAVIGLMGSGKTTILKQLAERLPTIRQSGDDTRKVLRDLGLGYDHVREIGLIVDRRLKTEGYNIIHDNDFASPEIRSKFQTLNTELRVQEIWLRIDPPEEFILANIRQRDPGHQHGSVDEALQNYYQRKQIHQEDAEAISQLPFVYTFDSSRPDVDTQIAEALQKIGDILSKK